jgi:serine/threonine protein kinase
MEFAGQDLASSLNNNWPSIDVIYDYMKQIANGISILNKFGIIHRDLKFQNIILSYENNDINDETDYEIKENLKLIDFGFSKILSYYEKTNEPYGTLCYLSPEIVNNEYYNNKEDIWTFGIIGYFFLTQTFPFFDNEYQNCSNTCKFNHIYKNFEEKDVTLDEDEFDSPKEKIIVKIVNMSLVKDIDKRASVNDILNTLNYHS